MIVIVYFILFFVSFFFFCRGILHRLLRKFELCFLYFCLKGNALVLALLYGNFTWFQILCIINKFKNFRLSPILPYVQLLLEYVYYNSYFILQIFIWSVLFSFHSLLNFISDDSCHFICKVTAIIRTHVIDWLTDWLITLNIW